MPKPYWTTLVAALLSSGLLLAGARQDVSGRVAGTVVDTTGVGLPATTVYVMTNRLTQVEISQIDAAQKAVEQAELQLKTELAKFVQGRSVVRFVTKEEQNVAQAEVRRADLELAAALKLFQVQRFLTTDATGGFVLEGLAPGSYVIKAFRDGFEPSRLTFVEVKSGQDVKADVTIRPF
jgi:Carboxypeptidase regulatory-like domain